MSSRVLFGLITVSLLWASNLAEAQQGFTLDRFVLAPTPEDGLTLQLPSTLGPRRWSARLALAYQRDPLVSGGPFGDVSVVKNHVAAQAAFAFGLGERFEVFARIPVTLAQRGEDSAGSGLVFSEPDRAGLGDLTLGGSAHLYGAGERGFQLGANAALLLPTGSTDALASDGGVGVRGTLTAALGLEKVALALQTGAAYRPDRRYGFIESGSELLFRVGAYAPVAQRVRLLGELLGSTRLGDGQTFKRVATPLEVLLGGEYVLASGLRFGLHAGAGLTVGAGAPTFRMLGTVGHAASFGRRRAASDADGDGLADAHDGCPAEPEDADGYQDDDGCPETDPDTDGDGIRDLDDRCPAEPEVVNGVDDQDGCPDEAEPPAAPEPQVELPSEAVRFGIRSAALRPVVRPLLERVLEALRSDPSLTVVIEGHSSEDGDPAYNQRLSEERAQVVARWLQERGVAAERLEVRGAGASRPVAAGGSEAARAANRRVEIYRRP